MYIPQIRNGGKQMRLCTICDKKIEGTWCKNCHRFVKTYDLPEGIHLNEAHDPKNDANCTYHVNTKKTGNTTYTTTSRGTGTTTTRQTYTQTSTQTTARNTASGQKKKSKGKVIVILIILYVVINFLLAFIPTITNCVGAISEEFKEGFHEEYEPDDPFEKTPEEVKPGDLSYEEKLDAMDDLKPLDEYAEEDYVFRYYDPRDIAELGFACDEAHFDVTVPEFEEWLNDNWLDEYEIEEDISEYYNYYYEDDEYAWLYFSMFRDYYAGDDFAVRVGYDTVTRQLHMFGFVATEDVDASSLYISALRKFDPETDWTQRFFQQKIDEVVEKGGEQYETIYSSDALTVDVQVRDGCYSVTFYPAFE